MSTDFLTDPLWYKDAVIYELHVRSFFDANNDGYGDFRGLRRKLPYLQELGVNTLWLLPFLESPLKDDGYDTADYYKILPVHGDLEDFKAFLDEAHARGMRVVTELVLNHTSDQHPWFQEARDPASPKHDWYVWSDTTEKYADARIIFTDTETSNWTWDRKAQKYYWHRFFSHQPDLNYDNPTVREAMKEVMFFWFDLGVDGLRLDAVPYLYEREGTNCENLPETIDYIVDLRQAIEARYGPGRVLLAEANQWPEDTVPYFADGEGVQMAFNFPIMPRMYMALRRENRRPLIEMMDMTTNIPDEAQWAVFLRNHDELTLEMVTDEERDYMYNEYAADPRFRINVGIRRRLAPLLEGDRRRIELMNALLLSLPGSPILYYGDEIGMGDDPFLGDRNGVRTPMQWSPDKHGGFSRAPHHRLFMPPIVRGPYSYEFVNVEDAEADAHSLLHFTRRMLALRNQFGKVFGRGHFRLLPVENQSILAFIRAHEEEQVLVVVNLSRYPQSAFLPPTDDLCNLVPIELLGQSRFPALGDAPYHLILGPYGFYWFALRPAEHLTAPSKSDLAAPEAPAVVDLPTLTVPEGVHNLLISTMVRDRGKERLEALLPNFVQRQRWFGEKSEPIEHIEIHDAVRLRSGPSPIYLALLTVTHPDRRSRYLLPLMLTQEEEAPTLRDTHSALAWVEGPDGRSLLHDATIHEDFWVTFFRWGRDNGRSRSLKGLYLTNFDDATRATDIDSINIFTGEQSNASALIDERFYLKLYRRLEPGTHPETELLAHLTNEGFRFVPALQGTVTYKEGDMRHALGIVQKALPVETDGWTYARTVATTFFERVAERTLPRGGKPGTAGNDSPAWLTEEASELEGLARLLGIRTAELHRALANADAPDLRPEAGDAADTQAFIERVKSEATSTRALLDRQNGREAPSDALWQEAFDRLNLIAKFEAMCLKIRVHGDYHLGQLVRADGEFYILDFEGEPARPLHERRTRDCALRDVAGMLRSLDYAIQSAHRDYVHHTPGADANAILAWAQSAVRWCEGVFLTAYYNTAENEDFLLHEPYRQPLLWAYLLDKALYEVRYEIGHRPDWVWLPLRGLKRLLTQTDQALVLPSTF